MQQDWLCVRFYKPVQKEIRTWPIEVKKDLGSILTKLQKRQKVGWPDVDSVRSIGAGCAEIRLSNQDGIFRVFFVVETVFGILVFHSFRKKTQQTPGSEKLIARKRLNAFLQELKNEKK